MTYPFRKLGCNLSPHDPRTLMLGRYLTNPMAEPPPEECDNTGKVSLPWGMYSNDRIGDCVLATAAHSMMVRTANRGHLYVPSEAAVVGAYSAITGYDPNQTDVWGRNPTDQGTDPMEALKYLRNVGLAEHKIGAFGSINQSDELRIKQCISLLQVAEFALWLPYAAQGLDEWILPTGQPLTGAWEPGSWGGHSAPAVRYSPEWIWFVSWDQLIKADWRFAISYGVRVMGVVSEDSLDLTTGLAPSGLDVEGLNAALDVIDEV